MVPAWRRSGGSAGMKGRDRFFVGKRAEVLFLESGEGNRGYFGPVSWCCLLLLPGLNPAAIGSDLFPLPGKQAQSQSIKLFFPGGILREMADPFENRWIEGRAGGVGRHAVLARAEGWLAATAWDVGWKRRGASGWAVSPPWSADFGRRLRGGECRVELFRPHHRIVLGKYSAIKSS